MRRVVRVALGVCGSLQLIGAWLGWSVRTTIVLSLIGGLAAFAAGRAWELLSEEP